MVRGRRIALELLLLVAGAAPLLADWAYRVLIHWRPFWVYYYDAETNYAYRGLHYFSPYAPRTIEHPGVPLQLLSTLVARFVRAHSLLDIDAIRLGNYIATLILMLAGLVLIRRTLFREAGFLIFCAGVWAPFLVPNTFTFSVVLIADILFLPAAAIILAQLWRYDGSDRAIEILGFTIAFAISIKLVFLAWLGGAGVMLLTEAGPWKARVRKVVRLGIATAGALIVFLAPLGRRFLSLPKWIWQNVSGQAAAPGNPLTNLLPALQPAIGWLVFALALLIILWTTTRSDVDRRRLIFLTASMVMSIILGFRQPNPEFHYFSPMAFASIGLVALLADTRSRLTQAAVFIAALSLVVFSVREDLRLHDESIAEETALRDRVVSAAHRVCPAGGVIVYSWHLPVPSLALKTMTTDPDEIAIVSRAYPREGHWVPWRDHLFLPTRAKRWDVAVIQTNFLNRFPDPIGKRLLDLDGYTIVERRKPGS